MSKGWVCSKCGEWHDGVPFSFAADSPDPYANLSEAERAKRTVLGTDQCVIDDKLFFIRGCLEIPIIGSPDPFILGLWVNVFRDHYEAIAGSWDTPGRELNQGPFKGRLSNSLKAYREAFNLEVTLKIQPVGVRPLIYVDEPNHPLALEQENGITIKRAQEIASIALHAG